MTQFHSPAGSPPAGPASGPVSASISTTSFSDLGLAEAILRAVREEGYTTPTPIQAQAIPPLLEGRDLLGCARTGTGKTAAFVLPILHRLAARSAVAAAVAAVGPRAGHGHPSTNGHRPTDGHRSTNGHRPRPAGNSPRALILVPTRELAGQVRDSIAAYGRHLNLTAAVVYGGVGQGPQVRALTRGVDVLVATPGRLLDLMGQGHARLDRVEILVLDEADQMLDLGFLPAMRRILAVLPGQRQNLLFSATMPTAIEGLAAKILVRPVKVLVTPVASTVDEVVQSVHFVEPSDKSGLLADLLSDPAVLRALVFTRTKRGADRVARGLVQRGIRAEAIHGNKSQNVRERALDGFRRGRTPVLVATDIAARGIDVDGITHVVNFELPNVPESYVHRIGRTARAGNTGIAISLCAAGERPFLRDIERLIRRTVHVAGTVAGKREHAHARTPASRPARSSSSAPREHRGRGGRGDHRQRRSFGGAPGGAPAHRPAFARRSDSARSSAPFGAGTGGDK